MRDIDDENRRVPTWTEDIRPMFTQYEVIKMRSVGQHSIDLASYDEVKKNWRRIYSVVQPNEDPKRAAAGWSKIAYVRIMPLVGEPWSEDQIKLFKAWADAGFPRGKETVSEADEASLETFVALSQVLTGFDELPISAATQYLIRLRAHADFGRDIAGLIDRFASIQAFVTEELLDQHVWRNPQWAALARAIILLWYNAAFHNQYGPDFLRRFPADCGTPDDNQHIHALVWTVAEAHPSGYSVEDNLHWQHPPSADGRYTGRLPDRFDGVSQ